MRILFPAIYRGRYVSPVFSQVGNRPLLAAMAFFSLYWIMPLAAAFVPAMCQKNGSGNYTACVEERASMYVSDLVHLAFASIAAVVVLFAYTFVLDFHIQISRLAMARVTSSTRSTILREYRRAIDAPFHWFAIALCLATAASTTLLFWDRIFDLSYSHWWGNFQNGISGLTYISIAAIFTFFAVKYFILLLSASIFLVHYARRHMQILPFDSDGMSGLSSAGVVLVRIWRQAALLAACLFLVFSTNYLDISEHWVVWFLASLVISVLPFAALVPFFFLGAAARRQKKTFRNRVLRSLRPNGQDGFDPETVVKFSDLASALDRIVVLPIQGWRFVAIAIFNAVQLYVSADAIWKGLPN